MIQPTLHTATIGVLADACLHARCFALAALFLFLLPPPGRTQTTDTNAPPVTTNASFYTSMEALDGKQKLGIGDRVSYRVLEDKDEARPLVISDTGELEVPYLGRVKAADRTCKDLAQEIKVALEKELYYQATVILAVDQLNRKRGSVYVVGQVRVSGAQDIPSDEIFTLSKAILKAGGFGDFADKKHVRLTRQIGPTNAASKVFVVDVAAVFEQGKTAADIKVEPGDLIFVPARLINF
jgi:polysaccharide biosynthesis/export protein